MPNSTQLTQLYQKMDDSVEFSIGYNVFCVL